MRLPLRPRHEDVKVKLSVQRIVVSTLVFQKRWQQLELTTWNDSIESKRPRSLQSNLCASKISHYFAAA